MPIEPSGTRPISTRRRDSLSQASEPVPMPIENTASRTVTTPSLPPRFSRAYGVKLVRKIEPKNHSQEMPTIELNTAQVSVSGFQLIASAGSAAGECGTQCAAKRPSTATASTTPATAGAPCPPSSPISSPAPMVPSRMATKVPISTRPLPPVSSCVSRCWGRYEYFTGPNTVDCSPSRKIARYSSGADCSSRPAPPTSATAISASLMRRMKRDFSSLSASWPLVAENSTNGAMNSAPIRKPAKRASTPPQRAAA